LKAALGKYDEDNPQKSRRRASDTAAILACRPPYQLWRARNSDDELNEKWIKYCQAEIPVGRDFEIGRDATIHYYYAQAMYNFGGDAGNIYRLAIFDRLLSSQNMDGSWPANNGISVGPVYATAVWCTILQLETNNHPSTRKLIVNR